MAKFVIDRRGFLALSSAALVVSRSALVLAGSTAIAVVVSEKSAQRSLSLDELRRIFLNKDSTSQGGDRFVPVNQRANSPDRVLFDVRVLGLTPDQTARYWIDQRLRGKRAPATVGSLTMLKRALTELPGAVGYLAVADLDPSLRALTIDGRGPKDANYVIR